MLYQSPFPIIQLNPKFDYKIEAIDNYDEDGFTVYDPSTYYLSMCATRISLLDQRLSFAAIQAYGHENGFA